MDYTGLFELSAMGFMMRLLLTVFLNCMCAQVDLKWPYKEHHIINVGLTATTTVLPYLYIALLIQIPLILLIPVIPFIGILLVAFQLVHGMFLAWMLLAGVAAIFMSRRSVLFTGSELTLRAIWKETVEAHDRTFDGFNDQLLFIGEVISDYILRVWKYNFTTLM